jgi:hypothetical protein
MASGFTPGKALLVSVVLGLIMTCVVVIPVVLLFRNIKQSDKRRHTLIIMMTLILFCIVTLTPAIGLNPFLPVPNYISQYGVLLKIGDKISRTIDLPEWSKGYEEVSAHMFIGFEGKSTRHDRIGLAVNNEPITVFTGENPMNLKWYGFNLPPKLTQGKDKVTLFLQKIPPEEKNPPAQLPPPGPFLVGITSEFQRGQSNFNNTTGDLNPYQKGTQQGTFMIKLRFKKKGGTGKGIEWWGSRAK